MEKPRVYIETTIPSAYFDARRDPAMVARREATRRWWATAGERYELVTSKAVDEELEAGPWSRKLAWLELIADLPRLEFPPKVAEITSTYTRNRLMPRGDAVHLALASFHRCNYLVTWNFKHLAKPKKRGHIQRTNGDLGVFVPNILSPRELLREEHGRR